MRRSTTSAGTESAGTESAGTESAGTGSAGAGSAGAGRRLLTLALLAELVGAAVVVWPGSPSAAPAPSPPSESAPAAGESVPAGPAAPTERVLADGRRARLVDLGGPHTAGLLNRIAAELDAAAAAVTAFWGDDWSREIVIAAAATDEQFTALAGGGPDIAAAAVDGRIVFAPGAAGMSADALRMVLRHELFHHAALPRTAGDAPRWLTEGVADFVARPGGRPELTDAEAQATRLPTDDDLDTPGPVRAHAYDRAWWFSSYVADRYGPAALRDLYLRACGPGHRDVATAVRDALGAEPDVVLAGWRRWLTD
ncbi:peptidase [Mycolicibacterium thermoresistibile]